MFIGQFRCTVDGRYSLIIPAHFRDLLSEGAFISQGFDRNVLIQTASAFQELYQRVSAMNMADPLARLLMRMILGTSSELDVEKSGRILIPPNLGEFAGLENEAVLVGQGDFFEIWAPSFWHKQQLRLHDAEANADRFAALNLGR